MDITTARRKLQGWTKLLDARHISAGRKWYADAHDFAEELAFHYGLTVEQTTAVISVLSPQNRWDVNQRQAESMCSAYADGRSLESVPVSGYKVQKEKAYSILRAESGVDVGKLIGGRQAPKTLAFYDNILRPDKSMRVTIDRWIMRALGIDLGTGGAGNQYIAIYRKLEEAFRLEAIRVGLRPCELQAAVWCCVQEVASKESWAGTRPGTGIVGDEEPAPF
jgi:hypothetical protein